MVQESVLLFADVRIDLASECVWRGEQALKFTPTAFALLHYLAAHPGRLLTKNELLDALWPETAVTEGVLTTHVRQIRQALGDEAKVPRYLETVHRRGYRWIAKAVSRQYLVGSGQKSKPASSPQHPTASFVGRETELGQLHNWLDRALGGERQLVFVTGEAGIGKTTLVDAFVASLSAKHTVWVGRGQCIEHYGPGEAYLPVLAALGWLCREPEGERLLEVLSQHAPTWLVQMPALLSGAELEALQRKTAGATRDRMLRELTEAVGALTAERPLVLWVEDLQWSDVSTLDWLAFVARRQESARLLVIGTFRPVEVIVSAHPLKAVKQELQLHGQCEEMALGLLTEAQVAQYLAVRCLAGGRGQWKSQAEAAPLRNLARHIHRRTDGNPLFLVNVVDYLVAQGVLVQAEGRWVVHGGTEEIADRVPESLRQMIETQIARLSPAERQLLEVASVAGAEFSAAAVAVGRGTGEEEVEERCAALVRRERFLRSSGTGEWPDGTVAARYSFLHALYQEVLYERVPAGRRARLHRRIGEREEQAYGDRAREIAAELAVHFERGRDYRRAIRYLQQAGENALRRSAYQEALSLLTKGLELLKTLPDTPERAQQEITLQLALSVPLMATKGFAAPAVEKACTRALELCRQVGETPQLLPVLMRFSVLYISQGKLQTARELAEQLLTLAQSAQDRAFLLGAHTVLGNILFFMGELAPAREHLEQGFALYDPQQHHSMTLLWELDLGVTCLSRTALVLGLLGYPDQALQKIRAVLSLAQELSHPLSLAYALDLAAAVHLLRREARAAQEHAEATIALSHEQGFAHPLAEGTILRGVALAAQGRAEEGIAQIRQGLAALPATGVEVGRPYYLAVLAEAYGRLGQIEEGLAVLAEALAVVHKIGQYTNEAELYRLKGQLTLQQSSVLRLESSVQTNQKVKGKRQRATVTNPQPLAPSSQAEAEAEAYFQQAIEIARQQQAKSLELRAVMSLARLWQQQGKKKEAHRMLVEIYGWFTEGFDTADLKEAKALLEGVSRTLD